MGDPKNQIETPPVEEFMWISNLHTKPPHKLTLLVNGQPVKLPFKARAGDILHIQREQQQLTGAGVKAQLNKALGYADVGLPPAWYSVWRGCKVLTAEETAFLRAVVRRAPAIPRTSALALLAGEGRDG